MSRPIRRPPSENFYVSLNDVLVGVLFLFILLLMAFALNFRQREARLLQGKDAIEQVYKQRVDLRADLLNQLARALRRGGFKARAEPGDGILRLNEDLLFESSEADLKPRGAAALRLLGRELAARLPCYVERADSACPGGRAILEALYIEGHTDRTPIRTPQFPSNWELSSKRAIVTYEAIVGAARGLDKLRNARGRDNLVGVSAYADTRPVDQGRLAPNRRVDFRFILAAPTQREIELAMRDQAAPPRKRD